MFERMLVPLDGSPLAECVLPHVVAMATSLGAQVTVLHVCEPKRGRWESQPVSAVTWQLETIEAQAYLDRVTQRLRDAGLEVQAERLEGRPAEQIISYAHQQSIDLVVLSSHGHSGLTGWNVSSVVQKVIGRARVSIMIVRAYQAARVDLKGVSYSRIMCPLDCSQRAEHVLSVAAATARAQHAQVLLAHVVRPPEMPRRRPYNDEELALIERLTQINQAEATGCLEDLCSSLRAEQVEARSRVLVSDAPAQALHNLVKEEGIDLVLMSAHGYSARPNWSHGSLALNFMLHGNTPLLIAQDLAREQIEASQAEIMARESSGH